MSDTPVADAPKKNLWDRFLDMWYQPISPARLRFFERMFAACFIYYVSEWGRYADEWLTTFGYHFSPENTSPSYPVPLPPMPVEWLPWFMICLFVAPALVIVGVARRAALFVWFLCAIYIQLVDVYSAFTLNKLFIVYTLLLFLAPAPKRVQVEGEDEPVLRQSAWPVRIIQSSLLIMYGTAGVCKMVHGDWLKVSNILYGHSAGLYRNTLATWILQWMPKAGWIAQGVMALSFEVFAPVLFLIKKLRPIAFVVGIGMHIVIAALMKDLIFFSAQMIAFYILFLPDAYAEAIEDYIKKIRDRILGNSQDAAIPTGQRPR